MPADMSPVPRLILFFVFVLLPLALGCWAMIRAHRETHERARIAYAVVGLASTVGGIVAGLNAR